MLAALLLTLSAALPCAAQQHQQQLNVEGTTVSLTISPTTLGIADSVTLTVACTPPDARTIALDCQQLRDALAKALPDGLTLAEPSTTTPPVTRCVFVLEPSTTGEFTIGPIELSHFIMDTTGQPTPATHQTSPMTIRVVSAFGENEPPAPGELRGLAEPEWPFPWRTLAIVAAASVVAVIGAALAAVAVARHRRTRVRTITADALALQRLDAVLAMPSQSAHGHAITLERISAVLRGYLEDRFGLRAPELTTAEFLRHAEANALSGHSLTSDDRARIGDFLHRIDMVKFAGASASRPDAEHAAAAVREFVARTADPSATLIVQRGRQVIAQPGAAARLLRDLDAFQPPTASTRRPHQIAQGGMR